MKPKPLRVMVVHGNPLAARSLARQIRDCGEIVVGPFSNAVEAMEAVDTAQAVILEARGEGAFWMADRLMQDDVPFVFTTGQDGHAIPARFDGHRAYARPRGVAAMLDDLHRQHRDTAVRDDDDPRLVVAELMTLARGAMPDPSSAERLVEAVLLRAVAETVDAPAPESFRPWLPNLMADEIRHRGRYLH